MSWGVGPIRPLAWEPPCAASAALKKTKKEKETVSRIAILLCEPIKMRSMSDYFCFITSNSGHRF